MITACNIRNYSIFYKDHQLFAYFEYVGEDFAADMANMAADPKTQEWLAIMMPMQQTYFTHGIEVTNFNTLRINNFTGTGAPGNPAAMPVYVSYGYDFMISGEANEVKKIDFKYCLPNDHLF